MWTYFLSFSRPPSGSVVKVSAEQRRHRHASEFPGHVNIERGIARSDGPTADVASPRPTCAKSRKILASIPRRAPVCAARVLIARIPWFDQLDLRGFKRVRSYPQAGPIAVKWHEIPRGAASVTCSLPPSPSNLIMVKAVVLGAAGEEDDTEDRLSS